MLTFEALGISKSLGRFKITEVGNNKTDNLMVSPERLGVIMHEGPTFPKEEKEKGSSGKKFPLLVLLGIDAIDTEST
jgi:hypothetical protein